MRNIPLAFLDEETLDYIATRQHTKRDTVDGFQKLAEVQVALRGLHNAPALLEVLCTTAQWGLAKLEQLMEMSGPNSLANLERAMRSYNKAEDQARKAN